MALEDVTDTLEQMARFEDGRLRGHHAVRLKFARAARPLQGP
jgi:hypothetical protein